jgi:hypothetical protein
MGFERQPTSLKLEIYCYLGFHCHRLSIQKIGFVLPFLYSIDRRLRQHGMPANQLQVLNRAIFADFRLQQNSPLNTGVFCLFRIMGLDLLN